MSFDPYEKSYNLLPICQGLKFYYDLVDKIDPFIYNDKNFPIRRGEIISTIKYLEAIPQDHIVYRLVQSHPTLTQALDFINQSNDIDENEIPDYIKFLIYYWIEYLLFSGCYILYHKYQLDFQSQISDKSTNEAIKLIVEQKAYFKKNEESYSRRYLKLVCDYLEIEFEKYNEFKNIDSPSTISNEVNELIKSYLEQIELNNENNDLFSSLKNKEFEQFIFKLKRLLYIPSYYDITKNDREKAFHTYLLGVIKGRLDQYIITSNKESGLGRYDICLNPIDKRNPGIIIEIKKVDSDINPTEISLELNSALEQIDYKKYVFELQESGIKQILNIAIVFNGLDPNLNWKLNENKC